MFEVHTPHRLIRHEYLPDSAGPGRWRGGLGVETEFVIDGEEVTGITFGDGVDEEARAFGLLGGGPGSLNRIELRTPDGRATVLASKDIVAIPRGTVFRQLAGGGGGWGDPFERPAELVASEVKDGVISVESARTHYGVWVDPETFAVERELTRAVRAARPRREG
jgi:N-methylhydantoinase B